MIAALIVLVVLCAIGALVGLVLITHGALNEEGPAVVAGIILTAASVGGLAKLAVTDITTPICRSAPVALPEETAK